MSQTYHGYACAGANHARHFIGSRYILLRLEARDFRFKKKLDRWKVLSVWNNFVYNLWKITQIETSSTQNVSLVIPFKVIICILE